MNWARDSALLRYQEKNLESIFSYAPGPALAVKVTKDHEVKIHSKHDAGVLIVKVQFADMVP